MAQYTKLFNTILMSTIWSEDDATRLVWITMLAMADQNGEVEATIPGLANAARVSIESAEEALEKLAAPDKYSRTPDWDGRRIEKFDGGWQLLNHEKYRRLASRADKKEADRARAQRYRERHARRDSSRNRHASGVQAEAEAEAEGESGSLRSPSGAREDSEEIALPDIVAIWPKRTGGRKRSKASLEASTSEAFRATSSLAPVAWFAF